MDQNPDEKNSIQSSAAASANGTSSDQDAPVNGTSSDIQDTEETEDEKILNLFPPGFRFAPTDDELVNVYLMKKINNEPLPPNRIHEVNLYTKDPPQLTAEYKRCTETEWYFFTPRDRKYPNGSRPSRSTPGGYWKPTGTDKAIPLDSKHPVAYKKTLDFNAGDYPRGKRTDWKMHEYIVKDNNDSESDKDRAKDDMRLDDWVLCRVYKRRKENNGRDEATTSETQIHLSPDNEAFLMAGNRNIEAEDQSWNAAHDQRTVSHNNEVSMMAAGNKNIGVEDQNWNAHQPTVNVPKDIEASSTAGNNIIGSEDQCWNAFQPTVNVTNNIEVSVMAGKNDIGFQDQTWNASPPTINVPNNIEASLMVVKPNLEFQDQTWNASQPTINVPSNIEASVMAGNTNSGFQNHIWNAFQPTVNVLNNIEAFLMDGNSNLRFEYQTWNASQPTGAEGKGALAPPDFHKKN
ncbi:hypothetical protein DITRI_Ditri06bG0015700 [Diplodiscus trichospermus]